MTTADPRSPGDEKVEVTAGGIARLAGVRPAAVSNWRRRHEDFPQPVGGTTASPAFSLAEVERWLHAHGKLAKVPTGEHAWQLMLAHADGPADALAAIGAQLADRPASRPGGDDPPAEVDEALSEAVAALIAESTPVAAYTFLYRRLMDHGPRQLPHTPQDLAELMAALAGPGDAALDPACGFGSLLAAAHGRAPGEPPAEIIGQDREESLIRIAGPRLALRGAAVARLRVGDSLLDDAFTGRTADTVLCHPPTNERHWGHDELAYDTRWEYGLPPRAESELAWIQHALAHLKPGGTAVLLLPPAVAARRAGRRIRAALLRRGALRAVIALPPGTAPPHGLALHLWILTKPVGKPDANPRLLLMDTAATHRPADRDPLDWAALRGVIEQTWSDFRTHGDVEAVPGLRAAPPVIELLDDETDVTPARHLPPLSGSTDTATLARTERELRDSLHRATRLLPTVSPTEPDSAENTERATSTRWQDAVVSSELTLGELNRTGAVHLHIVTSVGQMPSAEPGDLFVPLLPGEVGLIPRVVTEAGEPPPADRYVALIRPDHTALDTWFLAGFLRGTNNVRQAGSYVSSATRIDPRRLKVPRLPLEEQRRYGRRFRELADLEAALGEVADLGRALVRGTVDGLTEGMLPPG